MKRLVVIGGGITGLAGATAALDEAARRGVALEVTLLEAGDRFGGKVRTDVVDGFPMDWGPDSFLAAKPGGRELCDRLGLATVAPGPLASRTYLRLRGRLRPLPRGLAMGIPTGLGPLIGTIRSGIVGPLAAARAGLEPLMPRRAHQATVAEAARRRLGKKVARRLVEPLVMGVYGAPADEVAAEAVPGLAEARSVVLAMARRPVSNGPAFLGVRGGMARLPETLVASMPDADLRTGQLVGSVAHDGAAYVIETDDERLSANAVLVATEPAAAASILSEASPLARVRTSSSVVIHLAWDEGSLSHPLDAAGYLSAPEDGAVVGAATFVGSKWPHLGSNDIRVRATVTDRQMQARQDDDLIRLVTDELSELLGAGGGGGGAPPGRGGAPPPPPPRPRPPRRGPARPARPPPPRSPSRAPSTGTCTPKRWRVYREGSRSRARRGAWSGYPTARVRGTRLDGRWWLNWPEASSGPLPRLEMPAPGRSGGAGAVGGLGQAALAPGGGLLVQDALADRLVQGSGRFARSLARALGIALSGRPSDPLLGRLQGALDALVSLAALLVGAVALDL